MTRSEHVIRDGEAALTLLGRMAKQSVEMNAIASSAGVAKESTEIMPSCAMTRSELVGKGSGLGAFDKGSQRDR